MTPGIKFPEIFKQNCIRYKSVKCGLNATEVSHFVKTPAPLITSPLTYMCQLIKIIDKLC